VLLGRTAATQRTADQTLALEALAASGARVYVRSADVADADQLRAALADVAADGCPSIRGVVHAAGVLQHRALLEATIDDLRSATRAKVLGAWQLHQHLPRLDFFVLFSSASALLSSPRLAGYAAANAYLDALAHARRRAGQSALSINWGVWAETGMATRFASDDVNTIAERGMGTLTTARALGAFDMLLASNLTQAAVLPVDWRRWQTLYPALVRAPLLEHLVDATAVNRQTGPGLSAARVLTATGAERDALVAQYVIEQAARVLGLESEALDPRQPIASYGLDSLMAIELKNCIETDLAVVVPMVRFLDGPTSLELAEHVAGLLSTPPSPPNDTLVDVVDIEALSEAEVDRMLESLLDVA
jgi:NAD(P)-dependent dehydrogenase (short-subunit alcohol dehydrogenase family)